MNLATILFLVTPAKADTLVRSEKIMDLPQGKTGSFVQSADMRSVALATRLTDGSTEIVLNGAGVDTCAGIAGFCFAAPGKLAYVATRKDGSMSFVLGEKEYGPYEYVGEYVVSANGLHYAFVIGKGGKWGGSAYAGGKYSVLHDGAEGKEYDLVSGLLLSPTGEEVAYVAHKGKWKKDGSYQDGKQFVVRGTKAEKGHGTCHNLVYSADGKHLAYIAVDKGKWADGAYRGGKAKVYLDGKGVTKNTFPYIPEMVLDSMDTPNYITADGGEWTEDWVYTHGTWRVARGKKLGKKYDFVKGLVSTAEGGVSYVAAERGKWTATGAYINAKFFVIEGKSRKGPYSWISEAWVAAKGNYFANIVSEGGRWDTTGYYEAGQYALTPNKGGRSKDYALIKGVVLAEKGGFGFIAEESGHWNQGAYEGGTEFVVWGQKTSERYPCIVPGTLNLSPDGSHSAFVICDQALAKEFVVVDGFVLPDTADMMLSRMLFSADGRFLYYNSVRDGAVFLCTVDIPALPIKSPAKVGESGPGGKGVK